MGVYDRSIETALRLIERYGIQCEWRSGDVTPADPDRPWLGGERVPGVHNPFIAFVPATDGSSSFGLTKFREGSEVEGFTTFGLMAPQDFEPQVTDRVTRDGSLLVIKAIDVLKPADVPVLYVLSIA